MPWGERLPEVRSGRSPLPRLSLGDASEKLTDLAASPAWTARPDSSTSAPPCDRASAPNPADAAAATTGCCWRWSARRNTPGWPGGCGPKQVPTAIQRMAAYTDEVREAKRWTLKP